MLSVATVFDFFGVVLRPVRAHTTKAFRNVQHKAIASAFNFSLPLRIFGPLHCIHPSFRVVFWFVE